MVSYRDGLFVGLSLRLGILLCRIMMQTFIPPFTNDRLRRAVRDYLAGGARKQRIVAKYGDISHWDTSKVTDMEGMFQYANSFNQPLNVWNVSNVEDMVGMFDNATSFNQPLNDWKVANVTDMQGMFNGTGQGGI